MIIALLQETLCLGAGFLSVCLETHLSGSKPVVSMSRDATVLLLSLYRDPSLELIPHEQGMSYEAHACQTVSARSSFFQGPLFDADQVCSNRVSRHPRKYLADNPYTFATSAKTAVTQHAIFSNDFQYVIFFFNMLFLYSTCYFFPASVSTCYILQDHFSTCY